MVWYHPWGPNEVGSEADHLDLTEANKDRLSELGLYRPGKPLKNIAVNPSGPYQGPYTVTWKQCALANVTGGGITGENTRKYYLFFYAIEKGGALYNIFIAAECVDNPSKFGGSESQLPIDKFISQHEKQHPSEHDADTSKLASEKGKNGLLEFFQPKTEASKGTKTKLFFGFQNTQIFFVIHPETWNPKQKRFTNLLVNGKEILQQNILKAAYTDTAKDYVDKQWKGDGQSLSADETKAIHGALVQVTTPVNSANGKVPDVTKAVKKLNKHIPSEFKKGYAEAAKEVPSEFKKGYAEAAKEVTKTLKNDAKKKAASYTEEIHKAITFPEAEIRKEYADLSVNVQNAFKSWEKSDDWTDIKWYLQNNDVAKFGEDVVDSIGLKDFAADIMHSIIPVPGLGTVVKVCSALNDRFGGEDLWYIGDGEFQNKVDTSQLKKMEDQYLAKQKQADKDKTFKSSRQRDIEEEDGRRETVQGIFTSQNICDNLLFIQTVKGNEKRNGYEMECKVDRESLYLYFFGSYAYGNAYPVFIHESALGLLRNRKGLPKEFLERFPADKMKDPKFWLNTIELSYINNKFSTTKDLEGIYLGETYGGLLRQSLSCGICQKPGIGKAASEPIIYFVIAPFVQTNNKEYCALKIDAGHLKKGKLEENFNQVEFASAPGCGRSRHKGEKEYMQLDLNNETFEKAFESFKLHPPEVAWHKSAEDKKNFEKFGFKHVGKAKTESTNPEDQHNHVKFATPWMTEKKLKLTKIAVTHKKYNTFLVAKSYTSKHMKVHKKLQDNLRGLVAKKAKENDPENEHSLEHLNNVGMSAGKLYDLEKEYELMGYYDHKEWQHRC